MSSGRRRPTASSRSARRSWPTCSTGSTGGTRFAPGARRWPAECGRLTHPVVASRFGLRRRGIIGSVTTTPEDLPDDIAALRVSLVAERAKRLEEAARAARAEAELAVAKAKTSDDDALIAHQRLQIEKLTRAQTHLVY
jgi:hypothetical protein